MDWYSLLKLSESYPSHLMGELRKRLFPDVRFSMYHGTGISSFISYRDGELYEIRIEPSQGGPPDTQGHLPNRSAKTILDEIERSGLLDNVREVGGPVPSFVGVYQPDLGRFQSPARLPYRISVMHWKNSPYRQFFEDTKMREHRSQSRSILHVAAKPPVDPELARKAQERPWEMTGDEFHNFHNTGYIGADAYQDYGTSEGLQDFIKRERYAEVFDRRNFAGTEVEIRRDISPLKYCKHDAEGDIVYNERGMAIYMTDEEVKAKGLPVVENGLAAFVGDRPVGFASNEFGTIGVWVVNEMQHKGLGTYLLREFSKLNPQIKRMGQMTNAGSNLARSYHRSLVQEAIQQGQTVPNRVRAEYGL